MVPNEKILLGVPFYGYGWQTTDATAPSNTFPDTGYTVRYRELRELLADESREDLRVRWQNDSLTPYLSYRQGDEIYTVQFDDSRSLSYKLSLVNELELGGIAIWALGYEGDTRELWDTIERKL
jgi:spore germination protein YaaH